MNQIKGRKIVFLITVIIVATLLCIFLMNRKNGQSTMPVNNLDWGMEQKEVQMFYTFADDGQEVSPHIFYFDLAESQRIYDCQMKITLVFEEGYGLTGVIGYTDDVEKLQKSIGDELGKYPTGAQPSNGISWQSELVKEQYGREQIEQRFCEMFGESDTTQNAITGLMNSPLISYELKTSGNRKGMLFIDADNLVKVQKLLAE